MNIQNRLRIKVWQAKTFGKGPDYVAKTKCPICGSKLVLQDGEMDKYRDTVLNMAEYVSKAHSPKDALMSMPKAKAGVWLRWECSNAKCEFNGEEDKPSGSEK